MPSRILIILGIVLIIVGLLWPWILKLNLGKLPGDIVLRRGNFTFYFPIVTSIILSIIISLIFWLWKK